MTADAKVGLLLGLVFIAIIAFVINGLPDFVQSTREKPVVETAVTMQTGSSLVIEPAVVDVARSLQERRTTVRYVEPPVDTTVLDNYAGPVTTPIAPIADNTAPAAAKAQDSQSPEAVPQVETPVQTAQQAVEPVLTSKQPETVTPSKSQPAATPGLSHVVEDGESLGEIAKKYYGEQEGNKLTTIQMLYEANKTILESPDAIRVGDQLVIPKMKTTAAISDQAVQVKNDPAGATLMDKFKNVFTSVEKKPETVTKSAHLQPAVKKTTPKPPAPVVDKTALLKTDKPALVKPALPKIDKSQLVKVEKPLPVKGVTEYTIQAGDYPYKIAQKQLGDGNRYPEILKLNGLSEKDRLKVGTKIKIPKK